MQTPEMVAKNIRLHEATIYRRGRGVKNETMQVLTLGKPIVPKDETVAKDFDYSDLEMNTSDLIDFVRSQGLQINEVIARGFDGIRKSATLGKKVERKAVASQVKSVGLADDSNLKSYTAAIQRLMELGFSMEQSIAAVADLKAKREAESVETSE